MSGLNNKKLKFISLVIVLLVIISLFSYLFLTNKQDENLEKYYFDKEKIKKSKKLGENWIISNLNDEGYFNYYYDPINEQYSPYNNMIRQIMASRLLAEMSKENESLKDLHLKNLNYIIDNWYKENDSIGYIYFDEKSKLGAMAMMLRTFVYSPFFSEYKDQAEKTFNCIIDLQNENGSFEPWYIEPSYDYDKDYLLTFYSGEALLSMVEYYEKTKNSSVLNLTILSQDYYLEKYVENMSENYYPAYVPWHTQSLNKLYKITGEKKYSDAIMTLNDELLKILDTKNNDTLGRFYNESLPQYGNPHSSSDGVYTEGLSYAYEIALLTNDTYHIQSYKKSLELAIDNIISLQYDHANTLDFNFTERIIGAIRINENNYDIRVDTTQHSMDAFRKILEII